jgi:hypothetical protein
VTRRELLVCADDVKLLGENIHAMKKNTDSLLDANKEDGLVLKPGKAEVYIHLPSPECREKS